ncbi:hypothetical protein EVAR_52311_1 [Eumeta japonica]|uniref:Uncharacterized protein n=1 Tax=Eumeta variegata TaxID=151549 RepID=A0A4C1Y620_EUMVA|nr:hypothetical protein EVAR_52311_1 [Eumeta japonica]
MQTDRSSRVVCDAYARYGARVGVRVRMVINLYTFPMSSREPSRRARLRLGKLRGESAPRAARPSTAAAAAAAFVRYSNKKTFRLSCSAVEDLIIYIP